MFKRSLVLIYGLVCYAAFLASFLYAVGFVSNFLVPRSIDSAPTGDFVGSLLIDLTLLLVFAIQHSVMARPAFKRWWTRFVPEVVERSTYVLAASLALILLFVYWRPLGGIVWNVEGSVSVAMLYALSAFGFLLVLVSTFLINHFDLFGLRQVCLYFIGKPYKSIGFRTPGPYRLIRHPLYAGFILAFWATPVMSIAHLVFAIATTCYILLAIQFEEHDLVTSLGTPYRDYRKNVPMLIPYPSARASRASEAVPATLK